MAQPTQLHSHPHPHGQGHAHLHGASPETAAQTMDKRAPAPGSLGGRAFCAGQGGARAAGGGHGAEHSATQTPSVLAWPAWLRVAAVMPVLCLLWLAVWWANGGVSPW